jgi:hypothetical protein
MLIYGGAMSASQKYVCVLPSSPICTNAHHSQVALIESQQPPVNFYNRPTDDDSSNDSL